MSNLLILKKYIFFILILKKSRTFAHKSNYKKEESLQAKYFCYISLWII